MAAKGDLLRVQLHLSRHAGSLIASQMDTVGLWRHSSNGMGKLQLETVKSLLE